MRIYIAGALSSKENKDRDPSKIVADYIQNVHRMCKAASEIRRKGHAPFVPALDFMLGVIAGDWGEKDYRGLSDEFLPVCHGFIAISESWGVKGERDLAEYHGLIIFNSMEEISDAR